MTTTKGLRFYRITAFFTSLILMLSCLSPFYGTRAGAQGEDIGVTINKFTVSPVSGMYYYYDDNNEIKYWWNPYSPTSGHRFL